MGEMKKLTVEMFGPARRLSGQKQVAINVNTGATLQDVVALLAEEFPQLVGTVIEPPCRLSASYMLNYDGKRAARSLDETPQEGDRLLLLPVDAGG